MYAHIRVKYKSIDHDLRAGYIPRPPPTRPKTFDQRNQETFKKNVDFGVFPFLLVPVPISVPALVLILILAIILSNPVK